MEDGFRNERMTGVKVSVIIPSKGRAKQLAQCVRGLFETTRGHDVECVVVCDEQAAYDAVLAEFGETKPDSLNWLVWSWATLPAIPAFNEGLSHATGDVIMAGNDDLVWRDGWLTEALAVLETLPDGDGVVGLNDLCPIPRNFSAFFLATRRWLARENGGVLFCPHYHHNFPDPELCQRATASGRYVVAEKAVVEHRHPVWGTAEMDETYRAGAERFKEDQALYEMRLAAGFPDDFAPVIPVPRVFWCVPMERTLYDKAVLALQRVAYHNAERGYIHIQAGYSATDASREMFTRMFEKMSTSPDDVLVMLDNDHEHPDDVVERLAQVGNAGVVSALCRRRGDELDAMIYRRNKVTGRLDQIVQWPDGEVIAVDMGGAGAIAIRRWVFDRLRAKYDQKYWLWRYAYDSNSSDRPGEEIYFWRMCEDSGIPTACHTGVQCPHLILTTVEKIIAVAEAAAKGEDWKACLK